MHSQPLAREPVATAQILNFPAPQSHGGAAQPNQLPRDRMTFRQVATALCLDGHNRNDTIIKKLRSLHIHEGLPLPENARFMDGKPAKGADNICAASIWSRRKFTAWQHGYRPDPAGCAAFDAQRLAANAARLAGGQRP